MQPTDLPKNKFSKQHQAFISGMKRQQVGPQRLSNVPDLQPDNGNVDDTLPFDASIQVFV